MQHTKNVYILFFILLFLSTKTLAEGSFFGASIGRSISGDSEFDDDIGFKLTAGHTISENVAIKLSYINLGQLDANADGIETLNSLISSFDFVGEGILNPGDTATVTGANVEITGFELALMAKVPINDVFSVYTNLGAFNWDIDAEVDILVLFFGGGSDRGTGSTSDDGTDFSFGFGGDFIISKKSTLQIEWNRYDAADENTDLISIGLTFFI